MGLWFLSGKAAGFPAFISAICAGKTRIRRERSAVISFNADALDKAVQTEMREQNVPGASAAVLQNGEIITRRAYGLASVELNVPVTPNTAFCIGSLTKQFTSALVLRLVDAGELTLDAPIAPFFPTVSPAHWAGISVRQLLSHTSGIKRDPVAFRPTKNTLLPDYIPVLYQWARRDFTNAGLVKQIADLPLDFAPNSQMSYSNAGYFLLGQIVEKISGCSFENFLQTQILGPLQMTETRFVEDTIIPNFATGYTGGDELRRGGWVNPSRDKAAGSLVSTTGDLAKWDAAWRGGAVVSPKSQTAAWTPATLSNGDALPYGLGWQIDKTDTDPAYHFVGHGGMWGGFTAFWHRYTDANANGLTVIVLTNLGISGRVENGGTPGKPAQIARRIAPFFLRENT